MLIIKSGKKGPQIKKGMIEANSKFIKDELRSFEFFIKYYAKR